MTLFRKGLFRFLRNEDGFAGPKDDDDDGSVKVDLDDDNKDDDKVKPKDAGTVDDLDEGDDDDAGDDDGSLTVDLDDDKKKRNKAFAEMRAENKRLKEENDRIQQMVKQSQTQYNQPAPQPVAPVNPDRPKFKGVPIPETEEEWDALARKNWKVAVDMRAHLQAQEITRQSTQMSANNTILEKSKDRVISRHPELNDPSSEKTQLYLQILNQNPDYLTNPKGPIYAMRDMEEYMQDTLGYSPEEIARAKKEGANTERMRQSRANLASSTGRTGPRSSNTVTLSKDELEFCKYHNIDPKDFAKNKRKVTKSGKGGIQV